MFFVNATEYERNLFSAITKETFKKLMGEASCQAHLDKFLKERMKTVAFIGDGYPGTLADPSLGQFYIDALLPDRNKYIIEIRKCDDSVQLANTIIHELMHAISAYLVYDENCASQSQTKGNITTINFHGHLGECDNISGNFSFYGKMICETLTNLISKMLLSSISSKVFDKNVTPDYILKNSYSSWDKYKDGYSVFTSLTRLFIASCSNDPNISFDQRIQSAEGFVFGSVLMNDRSIKDCNLLLSGYFFGFIDLMNEFDKFMGEDSFKKFIKQLDDEFEISLKTGKVNSVKIREMMFILADFTNKRLTYMLSKNIITGENKSQIVSEFNKIWNSLYAEYSVLFTSEDIKAIERTRNLFISRLGEID